MRNTFLKTIGGMTLIILMFATFGQISVRAQDKTDEAPNVEQAEDLFRHNGDDRIVGTWDVQVTIRNCQTGAAIRTFPSITTFMTGGTFLESTSGIPQAAKTPGHGVWSQINSRTYQLSFKSFTFDAGGNFTGWQIVRQQINLNRRNNESESAGTLEVYTPNGTLVFTGCSTTTATRFG